MSNEHSHEQASKVGRNQGHGHDHVHDHQHHEHHEHEEHEEHQHHEHHKHEEHEEHHGSFKSYTIGFILSIVLTIIPLYMVLNHTFTGGDLIFFILIFAVLQFIVQLFFFMHIRSGEAPRYNVMALILGLVIAFTIVASSIWIMSFNSSVQ